jgi:anti-anti-sigma factor
MCGAALPATLRSVDEQTGFRLVREPARLVLLVIGPLDILSGPTFEQLVERALRGPERVEDLVVDLDACPFVTAAGFRSLLRAAARVSDDGSRLWLEHQRHLVEATIHLLGLDTVLCSLV